jgi:hypothetical protein
MTTPLARLTRLVPPAGRPGLIDWADAERRLIAMNDGYFDELEDVWETNGEAPEEIEGDTTLVNWARTKDADTLNWVVRPGTEPDTWPVMVLNGDANGWETYPLTATAFLAGLLAGEIDSPILSSELTPLGHTWGRGADG